MKLVRYVDGGAEIREGVVIGGRVVPLADLPSAEGADAPYGLSGYLEQLPLSAQRLAAALAAVPDGRGVPLETVRLLSPIAAPAAVLDCGMSPRHLANSSAVMVKKSLPGPIGSLAAPVVRAILGRSVGPVRYYKGNCHSFIGDGDTITWPTFSAYLDIEPELGIVTGHIPAGASREEAEQRIAGYVIFNDASARDVQLGEMLFMGPTSSKDFDDGNGLGPWIVTPDEIPDPRALAVTVSFEGPRPDWHGSTSEYDRDPVDVVRAVAARRRLPAGTLIGMGTVPDTCGLDRDEWLSPGERLAITFQGLGTLHQTLGTVERLPSTRWPSRSL